MPLISWICQCRTVNPPSDFCSKCGARRRERTVSVHSSERAVVYSNPRTGEIRFPARADQPIPEVYARQGYERQEIMQMSKFEKETGRVHEASNYGSNGLEAERETLAHTGPLPIKGLDGPTRSEAD